LSSTASKEEKRVLAPLLAKLHISPASTEEKLKDLYSEVSSAVDDKLVVDATGRNALFKIHVSLGKIVNALAEKEKSRKSTFGESLRSSARESVAPEGSMRASVARSTASVARSTRSVSGRSLTPEEREKTAIEESAAEEEGDETTIQQVLPKTRKTSVRKTSGRTPGRARKEAEPQDESGVDEGTVMTATRDASLVDELLSDDDDTIVS